MTERIKVAGSSIKDNIRETYEEIARDGNNTVENIVRWFKNARILELSKKSEEEAFKVFSELQDKSRVSFEQFQGAVRNLAQKDHDEVFKRLHEEKNIFFKAVKEAANELTDQCKIKRKDSGEKSKKDKGNKSDEADSAKAKPEDVTKVPEKEKEKGLKISESNTQEANQRIENKKEVLLLQEKKDTGIKIMTEDEKARIDVVNRVENAKTQNEDRGKEKKDTKDKTERDAKAVEGKSRHDDGKVEDASSHEDQPRRMSSDRKSKKKWWRIFKCWR